VLWPTPTLADRKGATRGTHAQGGEPLSEAIMWATPMARDFRSGATSETTAEKNSRPLSEQVFWATPNARDDHGPTGKGYVTKGKAQLPNQILWSTPRTKDADAGGDVPNEHRQGGDSLRTQAGAKLNATWVEALMGFPLGWTDPPESCLTDGPPAEGKRRKRGSRPARSRASSRSAGRS
jgi:hypothetical protein